MILAGDIGGTKTILALYEIAGRTPRMVRDVTYASAEYASLADVIREFLARAPSPPVTVGCFGVAGPVAAGRCHTTNLPWLLDEQDLAAAAGAERVKLLNDIEAAAYGMLFLDAHELHVLNPGRPPAGGGHIAVIAAGTGLGEGMLYWDGRHHHPIASEGGHADFAPGTDQEIALLRHLRTQYDHVSYERVLSGAGIAAIYDFMRAHTGAAESPRTRERLAGGDRNAAITELALSGADDVCAAAVELYCELYGAEAGNMALRHLSTGGVFVGGGIAPRIVPLLARGGFMRRFVAKGRFHDLLRDIPVRIVLNPRAGLLGAAHYALRLIA